MVELLARTDIALVSFDDERALWGDAQPIAAARRIAAMGPSEVVVKNAADPAIVLVGTSAPELVVPESELKAVDTTAAGDSFNAAYLAARLKGVAPMEAARAGHHLAAAVIRHPGAIIPRQAMPARI
jgi:2-dehydro-3-deoxygluconokinase